MPFAVGAAMRPGPVVDPIHPGVEQGDPDEFRPNRAEHSELSPDLTAARTRNP
ncbi:hypothetical protein [Nocardiopsis sp. B62]|uniref:hypothetical protein n=1 Tax=Nocardiopsis sp. B62 TaxID=2824874 RepID=UPI001B370F1C|nr:hypothetical protein [Nocardiopsis sp. B62]MBQ1079741.1 hypothetical protein [Nocardiopsis sp. B62]